MRKHVQRGFLALLLLATAGCDGLLEVNPRDSLSPETFWNTEEDAQLALAGAYARLYENHINYTMPAWDAMTDNAYAVHSQLGERNAVIGDVTPTTGGIVTNFYTGAYEAISTFNEFLANIENVEADAAEIARWQAEVRFLRALHYYYLSELYGGVPVVTQPYELDSDLVPRGTREDVVQLVMEDLDFAIQNLPDELYDGRAVKGSAEALKVRVLLASGQLAEAAELAGEIIASGRFSLYPGYKTLFETQGEPNNPEVLFAVEYRSPDQEPWMFGWMPGPPVYQAWWSSIVPTQDMVDAYEMIDGKPISESPLYDSENPYENRDPRFAHTIYYPGSEFGFEGENGGVPMIWGVDYKGQGYVTPYNLKKFTERSKAVSVSVGNHVENDYNVLRYAEVLLNYAEAQNEVAGPDGSVYNAVNAVRRRVAMPDLPPGLSQSAMRERIRNERRIELAFESGIRFLDLKRWRTAVQAIDGLQATASVTYRFAEHNYLWPIPQTEVDYYSSNGSEMPQNPGY